MDFVPTTMLASSTPVPSSAGAAATTATSGFAALLAMVEQSGAGALSVAPDQAGPGRETKKSVPALPSASKNSNGTSAQPQTAKKSSIAQSAAEIPIAFLPLLPSGVQAPIKNDKSVETALSSKSDFAANNSQIVAPQTADQTNLTATTLAAPTAINEGTQSSAPHEKQGAPGANGGEDDPSSSAVDPPQNAAQTNNTQKVAAPPIIAQPTIGQLVFAGPVSEHTAPQPVSPPQLPLTAQPEAAKNMLGAAPKGGDSSERSQIAPADPRATLAAPAPNIVDVQQVISAVTATAAQAASNASTHVAVNLPAIPSGGKQIAAVHPPGETRTSATASESVSSKPHSASASERARSEAENQPQHSVAAAAGAETPANSSGNDSPSAQSKAFPSPVQVAGAFQSATTENHESPDIPSQAPANSAIPSSPQPTPSPAVLVNSASLLDQMGKSELRLGMRVGDFGNVEIHTQMDRQQFKAEISVEHRDLGRALSAELPSLQQKLREQDMPMISLNLTGQGAGGSEAQSGYRNSAANPAPSAAGFLAEMSEVISSPDETSVTSGLDIRI